MESAVPERTLFCRSLDLNTPQTAVVGIQFLFERRMNRLDLNKLQTAVWSIFARACNEYRTSLDQPHLLPNLHCLSSSLCTQLVEQPA